MSSAVVILPLERSRYFRDRDGETATTKTEDESLLLGVDWTDMLATSETVSSVAYVDSGVTTSGASLVSPVSTVVVTGLGETEITATLSTGRKLQQTFRFYPRSSDRVRSDYP